MSIESQDDPEFDDAALVAQIRAGNSQAFLYLYEVTYAPLLRFAYQIVRSRPSAEDAVQSVFVSIWIKRHRWNPNGLLRPYLYRSLRNHLLDTMRHAQVVERVEALPDSESPYGMGTQPLAADAELERLDRVHRVSAAIRRLPERQRTAVILRWYDSMTTAGIAEVMGISRQAVEKLLRLAETRLRAILMTLDTR